MSSHPPAECCTVGVKHEGEPTGKTFKIGNIEAYAAVPKGKVHEKTAILYLPDVISIWQNSKLMADQFAANGYYTLIVDLFNGDALPLNGAGARDFDFMAWLNKGTGGNNPHTYEAVDPIVEKAIAYLKSEGYTKIGSAAYCFGAKYAARFLAEGKGLEVAYVAHPSFVTDEELSAITGPFSISAAETDNIFPTDKRHASEAILIKTKQPYQINLFSGVEHGFAVRGEPSIKLQKFAREQAFLQAVNWFDQWLL